MSTASMKSAKSDFKGLLEAVSAEARKWAVVFDFDTDSCYPAAAVSQDGKMSGGLKPTGDITGGCRQLDQFKNANTYCRTATVNKGGVKYGVYMYALYFQKDQSVDHGILGASGHRHDWEYALVWTRDGVLTHASFSAHGNPATKARSDLHFGAETGDAVKVVYHKDGGMTHAFRPAKKDEKAENELGKWMTPTLVEWNLMKSSAVTNDQFKKLFNECDFGEANCSFNDKHFSAEIAKSPPSDYPGSDEWKRAAA